jgi:hypothetical protein
VLCYAGAVTTKAALDRETKDIHDVRISATDGGGRTGYTTVRVHVIDRGDHEPMFTANDYKANVYSTAHIGTTVVQVSFRFFFSFDSDTSLNCLVRSTSGTCSLCEQQQRKLCAVASLIC